MDEQLQNEQTEEQGQADFLAGFNSVHAPDEVTKTSPEAKPAADVTEQQEATSQNPQTTEEQQAEQSAEPKEDQRFFGLSESEIKTLIERSAKVDSLEKQLRSAHGKFGELNQTVQSLLQKHQTTQPEKKAEPSAEVAGDDDLVRLEKEYPEIVAIAKKVADSMVKSSRPAEQQQAPQPEVDALAASQATAIAADPVDANYETEITIATSVLDVTRKGWRDAVSSNDFSVWLGTQPQEVRDAFDTTTRAEVFADILDRFDDRKAKAQDKGQKSKKQLEDALLPSGSASKVSHAPTPQDAFEAGFNSVRSQYQ